MANPPPPSLPDLVRAHRTTVSDIAQSLLADHTLRENQRRDIEAILQSVDALARAADAAPAAPDRHEPRVLVVDDNEINLSVTAELLRALFGLECDGALSGEEALKMAETNDYDLVFMDHMMPDMDGVETTARLRKLGDRCRRLPVVALTANTDDASRRFLLDSGMDDFLAKPLQKDELEAVLRRRLPAWRPADSRPAPPEKPHSDKLAAVSQIPGVDVREGLASTAGSHDAYERSLALMADKIPGMCDLLDRLFSENNIAESAIHVHGLKSSLAAIGAAPLSRMAGKLEQAGKAGDRGFFEDNLPAFVAGLGDFGKQLRTALSGPPPDDGPRPPGSPEALRAALPALARALGDYDYDAVGACLDPLLAMDFGPGVDPLLAILKEKADGFDYDGAVAFLAFHFPEFKG